MKTIIMETRNEALAENVFESNYTRNSFPQNLFARNSFEKSCARNILAELAKNVFDKRISQKSFMLNWILEKCFTQENIFGKSVLRKSFMQNWISKICFEQKVVLRKSFERSCARNVFTELAQLFENVIVDLKRLITQRCLILVNVSNDRYFPARKK